MELMGLEKTDLIKIIDHLVMEKARMLRQKKKTHCVDRKEAMEILGVKSFDTFYRKVNAKGSYIRKGSANGTYIEESVFKERDRFN